MPFTLCSLINVLILINIILLPKCSLTESLRQNSSEIPQMGEQAKFYVTGHGKARGKATNSTEMFPSESSASTAASTDFHDMSKSRSRDLGAAVRGQ